MSDELLKKEVLGFLKGHFIGVLATVSVENKPEATTIYYFVDDSFTVYFLTTKNGSKYRNMKQNSSVSLVVGTENIPVSAQVEGQVSEIEDKEELTRYFDKLVEVSSKGDHFPPLFIMKDMALSLFKIRVEKIKWLDFRNFESTGVRTPQEIDIAES